MCVQPSVHRHHKMLTGIQQVATLIFRVWACVRRRVLLWLLSICGTFTRNESFAVEDSTPPLSLTSMQAVTAATLFAVNVDKCLQQMPGYISKTCVCVRVCM